MFYRSTVFLGLLAGLAACAGSHPKPEAPPVADDADSSRSSSRDAPDSIRKMYLDIARDYQSRLDQDGDVGFKKGKRRYFFQMTNDDNYFRLVLPNFWSLDSSEERDNVMKYANEINAEEGLAKIFVVRDDTWCSVEINMSKPEDARELFPQALAAIDAAADKLKAKMGKGGAGPISIPSPDGTIDGGLVAYLNAVGRNAQKVSNGQIALRVNDRPAQLQVTDQAKDILRLSMKGFRPVGQNEQDPSLEASQKMTGDYRGARIYLRDNEAVSSILIYRPDQERVNDAMDTMLKAADEYTGMLSSRRDVRMGRAPDDDDAPVVVPAKPSKSTRRRSR